AVYLTKTYTDGWIIGQRDSLGISQREGNSGLLISALGKLRIDDLVVREIENAQLPDASELLGAFEEIEPSKRVRGLPITLPGIRTAGSDEPVRLEFPFRSFSEWALKKSGTSERNILRRWVFNTPDAVA